MGNHLDRQADSVIFISSVHGPNCPQKPPIFPAGGDEWGLQDFRADAARLLVFNRDAALGEFPETL
jgi:hypothetical protein